MAHVRAQIRDAVVTAVTGLGATVTKSRFFPNDASALPVFLVYTVNESVDVGQGSGAATMMRTLSVVIDASAQAAESALDDALDAFAVSIETAVGGNTFSGLALETRLVSTEMNTSTDGNKPLGTVRLMFDVIYRTIRTNPSTTV
jgi:hypothetical protein